MTAQPPQIPGFTYQAEVVASQYSVVYRYRQHSPDRDVAVKVLADIGLGAAMMEQRDTEANAIAELDNDPRIVAVITADVTDDGRHYIIMPFYRGPHLPQLIAEGRLDLRRVLRVGVDVAEAVEAVHEIGLLHGDIKPANILLDRHGPHLTDFGLAGRLGHDGTAHVIGLSLPWSPPEIVAGGNGSAASDVYSLGATLWNLLVGRSPFGLRGETGTGGLEQRIATMPPPRTGRHDVPGELESLLAEMMAKSPSLRPTARTVARRLMSIEAMLGGPAPATLPWHRPDETQRRAERLTEPDADAAADAIPTMLRQNRSTPRSDGRTGLKTVRREAAVVDVPDPAAGADRPRTRVGWWVWAAGVVAVTGVVVGGIFAVGGNASPSPSPTVTDSLTGAPTSDIVLPPGVPAVTAVRISPTKLRFTWTYADPLPTDQILWQTLDGSTTATTTASHLDLADPKGTQLCIEVKVLRAGGGGASVDWSPAGCGS